VPLRARGRLGALVTAGVLGLLGCATAPDQAFELTPEAVAAWAHAGWVDLREENMALWKDRFARIEAEIETIPAADSSSRFLRDRQFWSAEGLIQPGKVVGWIFATEEKGARMK